MGRWVIVEGRKESQSSEEWGGKQQMGLLRWLISWEWREIFRRATNLRAQWMGWGAGIPMGRWATIAGKKESQLSEEWRIEQRMGQLDGQAIRHGNIEQPSTYN